MLENVPPNAVRENIESELKWHYAIFEKELH